MLPEGITQVSRSGVRSSTDATWSLTGPYSRVFGVLNDWLDEVKIEAFGPELMSLRHELDADITQKKH